MFFKKKKEADAPRQLQMPKEIHDEMYQATLNILKTAMAHPDLPNLQMTPEQLLDKCCPPGMFSEAERTQLLKDALGQ